jgi:hypothetical protein
MCGMPSNPATTRRTPDARAVVIPAEAGTQDYRHGTLPSWVPAFAGMTICTEDGLRGNEDVRVCDYVFSMISICAPSGHSTKQTWRPLLGGSSSRMRTPFFCSRANVPA